MAETSASLLESLREQPDPQSWRRLVNVYWPLVYGWLRQRGLQHSDAEDIGQDVLHVLLRELPRFHYDRNRGTFRSWLRTIMTNRVRVFHRQCRSRPLTVSREQGEPTLDQLEDPKSPLSRHWDREHDRCVTRRLLALIEAEFAPATWQAFRRVACDGAKASAVAAELNVSVNAVFIAKSRVLRRLRETMQSWLE